MAGLSRRLQAFGKDERRPVKIVHAAEIQHARTDDELVQVDRQVFDFFPHVRESRTEFLCVMLAQVDGQSGLVGTQAVVGVSQVLLPVRRLEQQP